MSKQEELVARFDRSVWMSDDMACAISRVSSVAGNAPWTVKGPCEAGPEMRQGGVYRFYGEWQTHEKYGRQFVYVSYSAVATGDRTGVIAYLVSVAENVGTKRAEALWERYGPLAIQSLRSNPYDVAIAGIMPLEAAAEAAESLRQEVAFEGVRVELLSLLSGRGFQLGPLMRELLRQWGREAPRRIREHPYDMLAADMPSVGWKRADRLYLDLGHDPAATRRQSLCALYHIREQGTGDTWHRADAVGHAVVAAIGERADPTEALVAARDAGMIVVRRDRDGVAWVAASGDARAESLVATSLEGLLCIRAGTEALTETPTQSPWPFGRLWLDATGTG